MEITLIPADESFAEVFMQWRQEEAARRFNPHKNLSLDEVRKHLRELNVGLGELKAGYWRWFIRSGEALVGQVSLKECNPMMLTAEIGYHIGERFQRQGLGTQAVKALVGKVFAETKLRKLTALIHEENQASLRLIENLGFKREGLLREQFLIQGQPANEAVYGMLRSEWPYFPESRSR